MTDSPVVTNSDHLISVCRLRLRMKSPFFGTLAMLARFIPSEDILTAATDGQDIFFNPEFLQSLPSQQQEAVILHELLHAALLHPLRLQGRQPELWNIAADIVVNGMIARQSGCELPLGGLRDQKLEHLSVEEVYELLQSAEPQRFKLADLDLLASNPYSSSSSLAAGRGASERQTEALTAHWRNALQQAMVITKSSPGDKLPQGIDREFEMIVNPQLNWRSYLWRYLVQTPTDFQGFDRRLIGRGIYLEGLVGESVKVYLAIDTSGSVQARQFQLFVNEFRGILAAYPHLECDLYYADTDLQGPYPVTVNSILPAFEGGGGTSFVPFFDRVEEIWDRHTQAVCIYLTDGYGDFPTDIPSLPTLWVVAPGGLELTGFPFGEAVRLVD